MNLSRSSTTPKYFIRNSLAFVLMLSGALIGETSSAQEGRLPFIDLEQRDLSPGSCAGGRGSRAGFKGRTDFCQCGGRFYRPTDPSNPCYFIWKKRQSSLGERLLQESHAPVQARDPKLVKEPEVVTKIAVVPALPVQVVDVPSSVPEPFDTETAINYVPKNMKVEIRPVFEGDTGVILNYSEIQEDLEKLAGYMTENPIKKIILTGHTGSDRKNGGPKGRGDEVWAYNSATRSGSIINLGELMLVRATAIKNELVKRGVNADNISVERGTNKYNIKNRKVTIFFLP